VDSGPLIHLTEIGCVSLLRIFEKIHVPDAVWNETVGLQRVCDADLLQLGNVQRHTLPHSQVAQFVETHHLQKLHIGECECLYLGRQNAIPLLLTDDLAVREVSPVLGMTPVGSLGIIIRAYSRGLVSLSQAEAHIAALSDASSLFVTSAIIELAIAQIHKLARTNH
jgi:predicted nucleic acid-binding protein